MTQARWNVFIQLENARRLRERKWADKRFESTYFESSVALSSRLNAEFRPQQSQKCSFVGVNCNFEPHGDEISILGIGVA